jgi:hypothetical protein
MEVKMENKSKMKGGKAKRAYEGQILTHIGRG